MHRYSRGEIARLPHQTPKTASLCADDDCCGDGEIDCVVHRVGVVGHSNRPDAESLQLVKSASDIDDLRDLHVRHRARGSLCGGPAQRRGAPRLKDYSIDASRVGRPQDGAEVMGIFDAIQHDDQSGPVAGPSHELFHAEI